MCRRTAAVVVLAVVLGGCATPGGTGAAPPPTLASAATGTESGGVPLDVGAATPPVSGSPTWDTKSRNAAGAAGAAAVAAFIRKDLDPPAWAQQLAGLLTETAAADYLGDDLDRPTTDPENVPGTLISGAGVAKPGESPYLAEVRVPTDAGSYVVLLSRDDEGGWLVERYDLPDDS